MPKPKQLPRPAVSPEQVDAALVAQVRPLLAQMAVWQVAIWHAQTEIAALVGGELGLSETIDDFAIAAPLAEDTIPDGAWLSDDTLRELLAEWLNSVAAQTHTEDTHA